MSFNLLLSHPTGNANVRAAARAFHRSNWLRELDSCICWNSNTLLARSLPVALANQLSRRSFTDIPVGIQHSYPWRELMRLLGPGLSVLRAHEKGVLSIDAVYQSFDLHVASRLSRFSSLHGVYAYEDGALQTFKEARHLGLMTVYELPIGYWRAAQQIYEEERQLKPEWACTLTGLQDSPAKLARKDNELQLADQLIVPSSFVQSTLLEHQACSAPIAVVPYGAPPPLLHPRITSTDSPLKVLYVGSLGQRKGLSYALESIKLLGQQVQFTLIGMPAAEDCQPLKSAINDHCHIPSLPHHLVLEQMRQHDVLLFPTLFDGFGLVITEALSQGLPVIATKNSGAPECIRNGVEGFIVPIRDSQSIAERLQQLAENRDQLAAMSEACLRRAAELSWSSYEQNLRLVVGGLFESTSDGQ